MRDSENSQASKGAMSGAERRIDAMVCRRLARAMGPEQHGHSVGVTCYLFFFLNKGWLS